MQVTKENEKLVRITVKYMGEMATLQAKQEFMKMNLIKIFDTLILPNISITEEDMEEYEDSPDAYIKNDLEESDAETRRRHCMKFVQQLSRKFGAEVSSLIDNYMNNYLSTYQQNRDGNWKQMAAFLNLFITANITQYTYRSGATETSLSEEQLFNYIQMYLLPDLQDQNINHLPILKATCIKFVYMFRN